MIRFRARCAAADADAARPSVPGESTPVVDAQLPDAEAPMRRSSCGGSRSVTVTVVDRPSA